MRVYIHLDSSGAYHGNGGFLMLALLANRLYDMGYEVSIFSPDDAVHAGLFGWLDLDVYHFDIVKTTAILNQPNDDYCIITSWLRGWLHIIYAYPRLIPHVRVWCQDELLRTDSEPARQFVREHLRGRIAIANPDLASYYYDMALHPVTCWPIWIRPLFCPDETRRISGRIGYQPDRGTDDFWPQLVDRFGEDRVIACKGSQAEVAALMQTCDIFVWWNRPKNLVFNGEGFGLSLAEAVACGCAPVTRVHAGNQWLTCGHYDIPVPQTEPGALDWAQRLSDDPALAEYTRQEAQRAYRARPQLNEVDIIRYLERT